MNAHIIEMNEPHIRGKRELLKNEQVKVRTPTLKRLYIVTG
jgi:hypothetical protein